MHVREQVQLAALLATHAPIQLRTMQQISSNGLEQYWTSSKCRLDRWGLQLKAHNSVIQSASADQLSEPWKSITPVLEEIMIGDILTRVWTSLCISFDHIHQTDSAEPVARSVYIGHLEARNRALNMMVYGRGLDAESAVKLNRLRRRTERWTDMLLGYIAVDSDIENLGHDPERVEEFSKDIREQKQNEFSDAAWPLLLSSALDAFGTTATNIVAHGDLNRKIAASIMSCFGPEMFDSTGVIRSLWEVRISNVADDAQGMVEQLLSFEDPASVQRDIGIPLPEAQQRF
ncbi:MAG: hypothetical protein ACKVH8_22850 [Pirellulales bacterium]